MPKIGPDAGEAHRPGVALEVTGDVPRPAAREDGPEAPPWDEEPPPDDQAEAGEGGRPRRDPWGTWEPYGTQRIDVRPPPRRWLLRGLVEHHEGRAVAPDGLLPLGKVGMLAAAGGVGKTMAAFDLAVAVATGGRWFGAYPVETPGQVLLLLGEEDADEVHRRVDTIIRDEEGRHRLTSDQRRDLAGRLWPIPLAGHPDVALTQGEERGDVLTYAGRALLRRLEERGPWSLIVIDPASRFAGPDAEKDNSAATRFVQVLEKLVAVPGTPTVLLLHHTSQGARINGSTDATGARGVTGLSDAVRWQAAIVRSAVQGFASFKPNKGNYNPEAGMLLLVRGRGGRLTMADAEQRATYERLREEAEAEKKRARAEKRPKAKGPEAETKGTDKTGKKPAKALDEMGV